MFDIQSNKQVAAYLRTLAWDLDQAKVQCTQVVITHRPPIRVSCCTTPIIPKAFIIKEE